MKKFVIFILLLCVKPLYANIVVELELLSTAAKQLIELQKQLDAVEHQVGRFKIQES